MPMALSSLTECWVGLVFCSPTVPRIGHQGGMDEHAVLALAQLGVHLADGLQEGHGLDVTDRSA